MTKALLLSALLLFPLPALAAVPDMSFTVAMSEPVTVTGCPGNCPRIVLNVGGVTRYANFSAGSGTSSLTFTYSPVAGDLDLDGISISSTSIDLNTSGTIKDLNGNDLSPLTFSAPNTTGLKVNYPSLSMDFVNGRYTLNDTSTTNLASFITTAGGSFTRTSTATYFDASGVMQTAPINTARIDYDPNTHTLKGLLVEVTRTNSQLQSDAFNSATWVKTAASITANSANAPDGLTTADKLVEDTSSTNHELYQSTNVTSGQTYTLSIFLKAGERRYIRFGFSSSIFGTNSSTIFNLTSGTFVQGSGIAASSITNIGNGWYRCTVTDTANSTALAPHYITLIANDGTTSGYVGDGASGAYVWGSQLELGAFATSYISTSGAAATRQGDTFTIPISSWYSGTQGTLWAQAILPYLGGTGYPNMVGLDDGTLSNVISLRVNDGAGDSKQAFLQVGGVYKCCGASAATYTAGVSTKNAVGYIVGPSIGSHDGANSGATSLSALPVATVLRLGGAGASPSGNLNGWLQSTSYYPLRAANAQLQLLTQ